MGKKRKARFPKQRAVQPDARALERTADNGWARYTLTAELLSDAHLGSGSGGGGIDAHVARDRHGHPVIWASHVEGVLRDAARRLRLDQAAGDLFGRAGGQRQRAVFTSLYTGERPESHVWRSTARKAFDNRAPKDDTLRVVEYVPKGTKLEGEVELPANELPALQRLVQEVDALGGGRSTGAGRVKLALAEISSTPRKVGAPSGRLVLLLKNRDPLCITATAMPDNLIPSLSFVPGRALLGAVAAWLIAEGDRETASLLTSGRVSVSDALPLPQSPTQLDSVEVLPAPLSLQSEKPKGAAGDVPWWAHATEATQWRDAFDTTEKLKRPGDDLFVCRASPSDPWTTFRPSRRVRLRNGRPDLAQADASLFAIEQIVEETLFLADLRGSLEDMKTLAEKLAPVLEGRRWLRVGRAGAPVEVTELAWSDAVPSVNTAEQALLTLTSDLLVRDEYLRWKTRAGVGIRHKTGARASGVLYDREVIPAGTKWPLHLRVDWSYVLGNDEGRETEGILGYVLAKHWAECRCWLGGGAARGLGWCHLEDLKAWRLDEDNYERWVKSDRTRLPAPLTEVPVVEPTRSWCFRTLDVDIAFGAYVPEPSEAAWGLDMLAIGPHDGERAVQPKGDGVWAKPPWASREDTPDALSTDRAILMEGPRPLLPGSSVRGPLRHAFSRAERAAEHTVADPHGAQGKVGVDDVAGQAFGTVDRSSRILIRDARAEKDWAAAKLHMHAEDEFSAGSYGSGKRDGVRVLRGVFPVRIVIEGTTPEEVAPLVALIDRQVALGALGHLPIGGHKTRGAGWGRWQPKPWVEDDVQKTRNWTPSQEPEPSRLATSQPQRTFIERPADGDGWVRVSHGSLERGALTLDEAANEAKAALGAHALVAWWCDPTIDPKLTELPATFGRGWPENGALHVDEVAFFAARAVWRAARTSSGARWVLIEEVASNDTGAMQVSVVHTPARLHGSRRFASADIGQGNVLLREWHVGDGRLEFTLGFKLTKEQR